MQRLLWLMLFLSLALVGGAPAQVLFNFETDAQDWQNTGWSPGVTTVERVADPSGQSAGVLAVGYNIALAKNGSIQMPQTDATSGQLLTYHVWLPANFPNGVDFELWLQDNAKWAWSNVGYTIYKSQDIPKEVWFPLTIDLRALSMRANNVDLINNKIGKGGIQVGAWGIAEADANWSGTFYVDNVELIGAKPVYFSQFEADASGWENTGWAPSITSVKQVADPSGKSAGVLAVDYNIALSKNGSIQFTNLDATKASVISYHVWLPANFPNGVDFELWLQDNAKWAWSSVGYTIIKSQDIPKEVWFPLTTDIRALSMRANNVDLINNKVGKGGIQVGAWGISEADAAWSGTFYVDNAAMLSSDLGNSWLVSDFENPAAGVSGFSMAAWGPSGVSISRVADPSNVSAGVLKLDLNFANAGEKKAFISKEGIPCFSTETGTNVKTFAIDVWIPEGFPGSAVFETVLNGAVTIPEWTWTPTAYDSSKWNPGWNTFVLDLQALIDAGKADPSKPATFGVQVYTLDASVNWAGQLYFDNLFLDGIPKPAGALASPQMALSNFQASIAGGTGSADYVRFDWVDNTLGTEKYNIYMSTQPFTDVKADGVVKYASNVPHGLQAYGHRPFTTDGSAQTYYYAITATDGIEETGYTPQSSGSITTPTSATKKIQYVGDFANAFVLDGLDTEFESYKEGFMVTPENGGYANGNPWAPGGSDLDFKVTMIIDDNYLYFSGDVTDDDLRDVEGGFQAWQGDALELYMGFYNLKLEKAWHGKGDMIGTNGDWRVSFTSMGDIQLSGYISSEIPGLESVVFAKFTGDGYIVEAKFNLDSLAGGDLKVADGMWFPFKIDNTDQDPSLAGDEARTLMAGVAGNYSGVDLDQDWTRPHTWGILEVVGGPTGVADQPVAAPYEFSLSNNYPNPFNPETQIKISLARSTQVTVKVFDLLGAEIATLVNGKMAAGPHALKWDGRNHAGQAVPSGVYFCQMVTADYTRTIKMTLLK